MYALVVRVTRCRWRAKQNLDFSYLMLYARTRGNYYLQLEDDVIAKNGYLTIINKFIAEKNAELSAWVLLEFSHLGFIGESRTEITVILDSLVRLGQR